MRALVCTGCDDRTFIAGGNIRDLDSRRGLAHYGEFAVRLHQVFRRFETCPKPIVAAVNGWALGGGCEFLLTTDLRLMADDAKLGLPEIRLGLFPGGGGSQRLMRQIPLCQAKMMMFTGDFMSAGEAERIGLINRAVPRAELMPQAMALAARLAESSPWALRLLKSSMLHGADMPLDAALAHEQATISLVFDSRGRARGVQRVPREAKAEVLRGMRLAAHVQQADREPPMPGSRNTHPQFTRSASGRSCRRRARSRLGDEDRDVTLAGKDRDPALDLDRVLHRLHHRTAP